MLISRDPAMVLERIVASSLQNVLGAYFHGVEDKRLQLDVLSGRSCLHVFTASPLPDNES